MKYFVEFCNYVGDLTNIDPTYVILVLSTITILWVGFAFKVVGLKIMTMVKDEQKRYARSQNYKVIINVIEAVLLFFVWDEYIKGLMTLISVISAAFLLAIRDVIYNWISGLYIKLNKVFRVEDRIFIDNIKGDVMSISSLEFELLEVKDDEENGQSTGVVITFPNSVIFTKPVKNYTKGFKYIWNELTIKVELDSDIEQEKQEIYKIVKSIDEIKTIPKKTKRQINSISTTYRIYYNNYDPIIYTKIVDSHVELKLRYLMNPKKARFVESTIWTNILNAYNNGSIKLYRETK